jgi:hypothetical protein
MEWMTSKRHLGAGGVVGDSRQSSPPRHLTSSDTCTTGHMTSCIARAIHT